MTPEFAPDELYLILESFRPFLKSIDVRTFAVVSQSEGEWENLITSLVVSEKTVDEVRSRQNKLPKIRTNQIALFLTAVPFDYSVFEGFCRGDIGQSWITVAHSMYTYGNRHIRTSQFDPLKLKVVSSLRRAEGLLKHVLSAVNSNSGPERERLWAIAQGQTRLPKEFGYGTIDELIRDTLGTDDLSHTKEFELAIYDLAKIENISFSSQSFIVDVSKVIGLQNLQLNVTQGRSGNGGNFRTVWRNRYSLDETEACQTKDLVSITVQPPDILPFDHISLELVHRGSFLTIDETWQKAPLQNVVEPFYNALDAFCPFDKFREMLLKPQNFESAPEKIFEGAVAWLISLGWIPHNLSRGEYKDN